MYFNGFGQEPGPVTPGEQAGSDIDHAAATLLQLIMGGPGSSTDNQQAAAQSLAQLDPGTRQQVCASMAALAQQQSDPTVGQKVTAVCTAAAQPGGGTVQPPSTGISPVWMLVGAAVLVGGVFLLARGGK